jgi:anti-repressor protein
MELVNTIEAFVPVTSNVVGDEVIQTANARNVHSYLGVGKDFSNWIKDRIEAYGFSEGSDYIVVEILSTPNLANANSRPQKLKEYFVSIDMAKELSMVDRGERGKEVRKYFLNCEKSLKESLQRAPMLPTNFVEALEMLVVSEKQKVALTSKVEADKPKVEFFDAVVESELCYDLAKAAKLLDTGRTRLASFLREQGYMDKSNNPKQRFIEAGLMDVKFSKFNTGYDIVVTPKPFITGKGLTYFSKKLSALDNYLD